MMVLVFIYVMYIYVVVVELSYMLLLSSRWCKHVTNNVGVDC